MFLTFGLKSQLISCTACIAKLNACKQRKEFIMFRALNNIWALLVFCPIEVISRRSCPICTLQKLSGELMNKGNQGFATKNTYSYFKPWCLPYQGLFTPALNAINFWRAALKGKYCFKNPALRFKSVFYYLVHTYIFSNLTRKRKRPHGNWLSNDILITTHVGRVKWSHSPYHIAIKRTCTCYTLCRTGHNLDEVQYSACTTALLRCSRSIGLHR